jgi:hypothetical protein
MPLSRPSPRHLKVLAALIQSEAGEAIRIDPSDADDCCNMGWVELHERRYKLTPAGRTLGLVQDSEVSDAMAAAKVVALALGRVDEDVALVDISRTLPPPPAR